MKTSLILILLFVIGHACSQYPDKLLYKNRKYYIRPLKTIYKTDERHTTACHRGYIATWRIENDSLYLDKINTRHCSKRNRNKEIEELIRKDNLQEWYTGKIVLSNYKKIDSIEKTDLYEHLVLNIENGVCKNNFSTCVYDNGNMFINGIGFYRNGNYLTALAHFAYITKSYPDFFKIDWNYFYISSCLKYLGHNDLSDNYLDSLIIKYPKSFTCQFAYAAKYLSGKHTDNELKNISVNSIQQIINNIDKLSNIDFHKAEKDYKNNLILLFPWIYMPVSKYNDSLDVILDGIIIGESCLDENYELKFKTNDIIKMHNQLLNNIVN